MRKLFKQVTILCTPNVLPWAIICMGGVLRLSQYLFNRSLWMDESFLALNIIKRSFSELLLPLDYNQAAPIGFLLLERLAVEIFGNSEYTLRLFPFLSGIISLFLFYKVAKQWIKPEAIPTALGLFAISDYLVYYSSEAKQYSSDVAITLLLYLITVYIQSKRLSILRLALFGLAGAIAIWFSYPSIFILTGIGLSLILFCLRSKEWLSIGSYSITYSLWALSFIVYYFFSLRELSDTDYLLKHWGGAFVPFPPSNVSDLRWFFMTFFQIFEDPVGITLSGIAALAFVIGCISMISEKRKRFIILISPVFITLLVSAFHKWPFNGRLVLFIVPSLLLLIAEGAEKIREETRQRSPIIGIVLIGLLFLYPLFDASYHLIKPHAREEIKPVMDYVHKNKQEGDILYLYHFSQVAFEYYSKRYSFGKDEYIVGKSSGSNLGGYVKALDELRGNKRVWFLFSHVVPCEWDSGINKEKFFLYQLDTIGIRLDSLTSVGASVYLYDLREKGSKPSVATSTERAWTT